MKALLIDFGSTYTKVALANLDPPGLIGTAQAPTTTSTDLLDGLRAALATFSPGELDGITVKRACSSAAGGLRIVAIGLVPVLTAKAAREAALGAGARVLATYAHTLTHQELAEIEDLQPDLLLLAGGTDGGEQRTVLDNAALLAESGLSIPVVYAGNKVAAEQVEQLLRGRVPRVIVAGNVMPEVNVLQTEPARQAIRELYLQEITRARGLDRIQQEVGLAMPTPLAVLRGGELLQRTRQQDLVLVDIGGATTDVHSFSDGKPRSAGVILKGLPEPFIKRTVEGDLGMRLSAPALLYSVGADRLQALLPFQPMTDEIRSYVDRISQAKDALPGSDRESQIERALAIACLREALIRHAGRLEEAFTPSGRMWIQQGKDLTGAGLLVGIGGALVHAGDPGAILQEALAAGDCLALTPQHPELYLDRHYLMAAAGLLADHQPQAAEALLRETLAPIGRCKA